jgi:PAS domain S-box-containing protein
MDLLLDAVCAVDRQGRFVFVSAACERIFGYTPDELIGRPMIELVHPADRQRTLAAAHDIMGGEPKHNFRKPLRAQGWAHRNILWSARWSEVDQLRIAVARDITERKQANRVRLRCMRFRGGACRRRLAGAVQAHSPDHRRMAAGAEFFRGAVRRALCS